MPGLTEPNQVSKREDLADLYSIADMKETPFTTRLRKSKKPTNSEYDWTVDAYATAKVTGTVDGSDVADYENHAANRARLGNYIQIFRRTAKVSRLAEHVSVVAGVPSEIGLASAKKLVELKRDVEATFLQNGVNGQLDTGAVPYLTASLGKWIDTTGPTIPKTVPAAFATPTAQIITTATASLTEDAHVQAMLQAVYDNTGMNGEFVLFAGSTLRRRFTDMTRTIANTNSTATKVRMFSSENGPKVSSTTTIFQGDYGTIEIVSSNFIGADYTTGGNTGKNLGYLCDMDKLHMRSNKTPGRESFDDTGGGPRIMIEAVCGLQVDNPLGLGAFKPAS